MFRPGIGPPALGKDAWALVGGDCGECAMKAMLGGVFVWRCWWPARTIRRRCRQAHRVAPWMVRVPLWRGFNLDLSVPTTPSARHCTAGRKIAPGARAGIRVGGASVSRAAATA